MKKAYFAILLCMLVAISCLVVACHTHTYSVQWSSDETHHWHVATCEHEFEIRDRDEHSYGQDNVCIICLRVKTIEDADHQHTYSDQWSGDDIHHWHAATCEHTDIIRDKARHTYSEDNDKICTECGYEHEHSYSTSLSRDNTYHWYASTCGHNSAVKDKALHDCDENNICKVCSYLHQHTYSDQWSSDETYHWHASTCGHESIKDKAMHDFTGGKCSQCDYGNIEGLEQLTATTGTMTSNTSLLFAMNKILHFC